MAEIIDVRNSDGYLVVLGNALILPNSSTTSDVFPPYQGAIRFNTASNVCEYYTTEWNQFGAGGGGGGTLNYVNITGDATGSTSTGPLTLTLASVGTAGTYSNLTVDAKGRVTTIRALNGTDISTALAYTPANINSPNFTGVPKAPTASLSDVSYQITNTSWVTQYIAANTLIPLQSTSTFYVSTAGNDSNPGTVSQPFATLTAAWNALTTKYNVNGQNVTIFLQNGTYGPQTLAGVPVGVTTNNITILGDNGTPGNVVFQSTGGQSAISVYNGANPTLTGFTVESASGDGILVQTASCNIETIVFGTCGGSHLQGGGAGSYITFTGSYFISGSAQCHLQIGSGGAIILINGGFSILNNCSFSSSFVSSTSCGNIVVFPAFEVYVAPGVIVTGLKSNANLNGVINTNGQGGANYFPGSITGTSSTGGVYG